MGHGHHQFTYIGSPSLPSGIGTDTERAPMLNANQIDPIRFEVIRNALSEATEEMAIALRRSAYSTNIKTRADFSCVFFDSRVRVVAQAFAQPVHLGSLSVLVPRMVEAIRSQKPGPWRRHLGQRPLPGRRTLE